MTDEPADEAGENAHEVLDSSCDCASERPLTIERLGPALLDVAPDHPVDGGVLGCGVISLQLSFAKEPLLPLLSRFGFSRGSHEPLLSPLRRPDNADAPQRVLLRGWPVTTQPKDRQDLTETNRQLREALGE